MAESILLDLRYELMGPLGRGGEAEVLRARDLRSGEEVAIRLPLPGQSGIVADVPATPLEFHPGWVRMLSSGRDHRYGIYQVFELLEGETFRQKIERSPLDPIAWLAFGLESLAAVAALHAAGWAHGDLNADNFLQLESSPPDWKLLELPFLRPAGRKAMPFMFGSIHTLAPEQLEGHVADALSDVFALGCLYYYGAAGEFPHGASQRDIAIGRLRFEPEPLGVKAPGFPAAACKWVMTLLERDPLKRPTAAVAARQLLTIA
jgi:serine/threonine protein kinase